MLLPGQFAKTLFQLRHAKLKRALQLRNRPQHVDLARIPPIFKTDPPLRPMIANILQLLRFPIQHAHIFAKLLIHALHVLPQRLMMRHQRLQRPPVIGQRFNRSVHAGDRGAVELHLLPHMPVQRTRDGFLKKLRDRIL